MKSSTRLWTTGRFGGTALRFRRAGIRLVLGVLCLGLSGGALAAPPAAPPGSKWVVNDAFTDEFDGTSLNTNKWYDYHPWWEGRPPAKFMPWTVSVTNGLMQIKNDVLNPPQGSFNIAGGAVVSRTTAAYYGYYEVRMKASRISMSSTFWMSNPNSTANGVTSSQEIDIQETIGAPNPTPVWAANWNKRMNSNTHYKYAGPGPATNHSVGDNVTVSPPAAETGDDFHVYGAWWVDANTIHFYHNDQFVFTLHPSTNVVANPFDQPMHINMVTETYDWQAPPATQDLTNSAINTTYYDWVRAYVLDDENAPPLDPAIVWQDENPQTAASVLIAGIAMEPGVADPLGGTNLVSRFYYPNPTHSEFRDTGVNGDANGYFVPGLTTSVRAPLGGGGQYANLDSNYLGRPFTFSVDVYVPSGSQLGNDPNDKLGILIRWQNAAGSTLLTTPQTFANLSNHAGWQTLTLTGTSPTGASYARVAPLLATRDNGSQVSQNSTVYYLRNLDFQLLGPAVSPTLTFSRQGADLLLDWTAAGFMLQSQALVPGFGLGTNWLDFALPAGTNPPVTVPINPSDGGTLFRLAPQ